jgi:hypothetical protein
MANPEELNERALQILHEKQAEARAKAEQRQLFGPHRTPDDPNPRTKSSRHRKTTADKWNQ